ncbi:class I SAM-dependent methyltransferase [Streptomyces syringium]|uniref:class I SAM-dependent methyltransferase n=1 Tax=Streptomyces syringium TaxID=76729 RepID=UPI003451D021
MTVTADEIVRKPYVQLLAMLGESNLPPGGLATVHDLALHLHLRPGVKALHAGCNAGFLSRELARRTGASILGIDISPDMAEAANLRAKQEGLDHLVRYEQQDTRELPFAEGEFDVVLSGGAMAFVRDHRRAVDEQIRVTKTFGLLGDVQFYYREQPPQEILDRVSEVIEVPVPQYTRDYWLDLYDTPLLQPYWRADSDAAWRTDEEVEAYSLAMVERCAQGWSEAAREALFERFQHIFGSFNENMKYLSYTTYVYRKVDAGSEPALFL